MTYVCMYSMCDFWVSVDKGLDLAPDMTDLVHCH